MGNNKFYMKVEGETREEILESIEKIKKSLENAIIGEEKEIEEDEFECNGDCENCENYVEENDPEDVLDDLGRVISCLVYYGLPLPRSLVKKYNDAFLEIKDADSEDS